MSAQKGKLHALHAPTAILTRGFDPSLSVGSARPAVFRSSTYVFPTPEAAERAFDVVSGRERAREHEAVDLIYSRFNHPNAEILENQIVPLEPGARTAVVFNSGLAAIMTTFFTYLRPGDALVHTVPLYGGTQHQIHEILEPYGVRSVPVPAGDTQALSETIARTENLRLVFIETPANPTLTMTGIRDAADAIGRRKSKPLLVVDNTFLGPMFQHPLKHGADLVVYSATKYLSGFSDILAGVVLAEQDELAREIRAKRGLLGNILQPDECWILDGRLPTVPLRMNRQSKNAQRLAEQLAKHPAVDRIHYPTLFENPEQIRIRDAQCLYPGAMLSLELHGGKPAAFEFLRNLTISHNAVSLGGVETLVCHPKTTIHSGLSAEELKLAGITDGLVRVSIGIEDWRDLLEDFTQALDAAERVGRTAAVGEKT